jgi:arabinan endo-1,5-alpha-L-arabinosidase
MGRRSVLKSIGVGAVGAAGSAGLSGTAAADDSSTHYHNPTGPIGFGDPSVIDDGNGTYYVYGTENPYDVIPIAKSNDLVSWEYIGAALDSTPGWHSNSDAGAWAPDINYWNGQYHLYYSLSIFGSDQNPGIGLATADSPEGPFTDQGPVFREADLDLTNCIDSEFVVVDGTPYIVWGSYYGFYGVELTPDGTDYVAGTDFQIAGDVGEGPMIIQENGYYYLFYSTGKCCEGYDSTYEVEVARSESFFGPYVNQNGDDLRDLNEFQSGVQILSETDRFTGPGHNTAYQDSNGDWWMIYHAEGVQEQDEATRTLMADRIQFNSQDWPVVACDGRPSSKSPVPGSGSYSCDSPDPITDGTYRIRNLNSGKLLEVYAAGTSDGDNVDQYGFTDNTCQEWVVTYQGNGEYTIENNNSGKMLDVNAASTDDGATVIQWADNGGANQRWYIYSAGPGEYNIENVNSGKLLDVNAASTEDGADVIQWADNGGWNQRWTFEPASPWD